MAKGEDKKAKATATAQQQGAIKGLESTAATAKPVYEASASPAGTVGINSNRSRLSQSTVSGSS